MENKIKYLIEKVIIPNYPLLYEVDVQDVYKDLPNMKGLFGLKLNCLFKSSECLPSKKQMEINNKVKELLKMVSIESFTGETMYSVSCYFDCGNGYEFHSEVGYDG